MKSLLVASAQGGTGRTALVCQLAHYLRLVRHDRVLVIDLAEPACSAMSLAHSARAYSMRRGPANARRRVPLGTAAAPICVLAGEAVPGCATSGDPVGARCYANLRHLLSHVAPSFDVCLIDSPPWPDRRAVCAAALADAVVAPIRVSPDASEQVADFIHGANGLRQVRARLNPSLCLIGVVPNGVETTPWCDAQLKRIEASLGAWLVPHAWNAAGYLRLPRLDAIAQAQACGVSVADLTRDDAAARDGWLTLSACFDVLACCVDRVNETTAPAHIPEVCDA